MYERISFLSKDVEVVSAIAFNLEDKTSHPVVTLKINNWEYYIEDRYIMWRFLDLLDNEKFYYNSYLNVTNEIPLELIIKDFIHDYPATLMRVWVEDDIIVGFDGNKNHEPKETSRTMLDIAQYLQQYDDGTGELEDWKCNIRLAPYRQGKNNFSGLVATYIYGDKIIEIISRYQLNKHHVWISGRYAVGSDFAQPVDGRVWSGRLSTIPVSELYGEIDTLIMGLKVLEEKDGSKIEGMSKNSFKLNIDDRNRLERENSSFFF